MGRTRTNKIVVFEGDHDRIGRIFRVHIERANGFSLYGTPVVQLCLRFVHDLSSLITNRRHYRGSFAVGCGFARRAETCAFQRTWPSSAPFARRWHRFAGHRFDLELLAALDDGDGRILQFPQAASFHSAGWFFLVVTFVDEFLAVRALGILFLLGAEPLLDAAFFQNETSRLLVTVFAYLLIVAGLFWVTMPYVFRDQLNWSTEEFVALARAARHRVTLRRCDSRLRAYALLRSKRPPFGGGNDEAHSRYSRRRDRRLHPDIAGAEALA